MNKIRKGDEVIVKTGKSKGQRGTVIEVFADGRVLVEGVNVAKKHQAPTRADQQGGIIDKAMPIDASNVAVISPKDGKATRVGYKVLDDGSKIRVCKRTGEEIK